MVGHSDDDKAVAGKKSADDVGEEKRVKAEMPFPE
jgi:hypothetical protein